MFDENLVISYENIPLFSTSNSDDIFELKYDPTKYHKIIQIKTIPKMSD